MSKKLFIDFSAVSWKYINWSIIRYYVSRLQQRVYKAAFKQEYGKMRRLQKKLLSSSYSKLLSIFVIVQHNTISQLRCYKITSNDKLMIAKHLKIGLSADCILISSVQAGIKKSHGQLLSILIGQAQQFLAELAIKPEWAAKSTRNLYRFTIDNYSKKKNNKAYETLMSV